MVHARRFFSDRRKRENLSALRTVRVRGRLLTDSYTEAECESCGGSGFAPGTYYKSCESCNGTGVTASKQAHTVFRHSVAQVEQFVGEMEEFLKIANRRYANVAALYRNW